MKKKGFIAMSMLYSFLIVFIAIIFALLALYSQNIININNINKETISKYNDVKYCDTCSNKITNNFRDISELKAGDYVKISSSRYKALFIVYESIDVNLDNKVILISENSTHNSSDTIINFFVNTTNNTFINNTYTSLYTSRSDNTINTLFPDANVSILKKEDIPENLYAILATGEIYVMDYTDSDDNVTEGLIFPNITIGSKSIYSYLYNPSTKAWKITPNSNKDISTLASETFGTDTYYYPSDYDLIFIKKRASEERYFPKRIFIELKSETKIKSGNGTRTNPYTLEMGE